MEHISKFLEQNQQPQLSLKEVLAAYDHIELTEDELTEALITAKRQKEERNRVAELRHREEINRRYLTEQQWGFEQTKGFMLHRISVIYGPEFKMDEFSQPMFKLLCLYFANDPRFVEEAEKMGVKSPSLQKGICLVGNFGVGKTWLMKLFARNQRQGFAVVPAKTIANTFETAGEDGMDLFGKPQKLPVNDAGNFYQTQSGLCIDDIGTEDIKIHYGNKKNVIGDLIEIRYTAKHTGVMLHATTNLTSDQLGDFYGGRVVSRLREVINWIELKGKDRRK